MNSRLTLSRRWIDMIASAKRLATLMTLQQGGRVSNRYSMVSVKTSSLIGLRAILAAEPREKTPCETQAVDVLATTLLAGDGHLDQGSARDREVVDDQDVLAPHVANDVEHFGLLVVAPPHLVAEDHAGGPGA